MWFTVLTTGVIGLSWLVFMVVYILRATTNISKMLLNNNVSAMSSIMALATGALNLIVLHMIYIFVKVQNVREVPRSVSEELLMSSAQSQMSHIKRVTSADVDAHMWQQYLATDQSAEFPSQN